MATASAREVIYDNYACPHDVALPLITCFKVACSYNDQDYHKSNLD